MEALIVLAIVGGAVAVGFVIPYLMFEGMPKWLQAPGSRKKHRRQLLEFIEWRRAKDLKEFVASYKSEAEWNEGRLADWVRRYNNHPGMYRQDMLAQKGETELMQWVLKNDRSVLQSRIQELENELGIRDV